MKNLLMTLLFCFAINPALAQKQGIENLKELVMYAVPKLPAKITAASIKNLKFPNEFIAKKSEYRAEAGDLDDTEIKTLAAMLKVTPAGFKTAIKYLLQNVQDAEVVAVSTALNVKDFGAKGDGIANDYAAFRKAIDKINLDKTGELFIPKGTYYINEMYVEANEKIKGKPTGYNIDLKGVRTLASSPSLAVVNCSGVKIYGEKGSKIVMKGDFHRSGERQMDDYVLSGISAIPAIKMVNCNNIIISDLEFLGGIEKTTRDSGVNESGGGSLVQFSGCTNGQLTNLTIENAQTDGLNFASSREGTNDNFTITNVKMLGNARQGMTAGNLINSTFINCDFSNTGTGRYSHAPKAGIDVEANVGGSWGTGIIRNENIEFKNCRFDNNAGGATRLSHPSSAKDIRFINCEMSNATDARYFITVNTKGVLFDSCKIDAGNGIIYGAWQSANTSAVFKNCYIKGSGKTIIVQPNGDSKATVLFENNTIEYYGKDDNAIFPHIRFKGVTFKNNTLVYPARLKKWRKIVTAGNQSGTKIIRN